MWQFLAPMAIQGGLGLLNNQHAKKNEDADRKLAAETARYSPWTNMAPQPIRRANSAFSDIGGGLMSGLATGQSLYQNFPGGDAVADATAGTAQKGIGVGYQPGMLGAKTKLNPMEDDPYGLRAGSSFMTAGRPKF